MLPPRDTAPRSSIASGTTVRYARTTIARPTRTTSARSDGARSATRRAATPAEVISAGLFDAEGRPPEGRVLVEIGPHGHRDVEDLREVREVGVLRRDLRVRRHPPGRLDRELTLVRGHPLHEQLARVRVRGLVRERHRLHVGDDRVGPRPVDRLLRLVLELREPVP